MSKLRKTNLKSFETAFFSYQSTFILRLEIKKNIVTLHCDIQSPLLPSDDNNTKKQKFIDSYRYFITFFSRFRNNLLKINTSYTDMTFPTNMAPKTCEFFCNPISYQGILQNIKYNFLTTNNF